MRVTMSVKGLCVNLKKGPLDGGILFRIFNPCKTTSCQCDDRLILMDHPFFKSGLISGIIKEKNEMMIKVELIGCVKNIE